MKKFIILVFLLLLTLGNISIIKVSATTQIVNSDDKFNEILDGLDNEYFTEITNFLQSVFNESKSFKEWVIAFITGNLELNFESLSSYLKGILSPLKKQLEGIILSVLACAILCYISNIILSKNNDSSEKNTIYFISYTLAVTLISGVIFNAFTITQNALSEVSKNTEKVFPILFSLSSLIGSFGVQIYKPISVFISYFTSKLTTSYFIPLLSLACILSVLGNLGSSVKLKTFYNSITSLYKWSLGIISILFTVFIGSQTLVNAQYNGISVRILKYTTGSLVPIVGGFLSGGIDTLLSSAILIKNSIGLIFVLFVLLSTVGKALIIVITSFIIKFYSGAVEPIADSKINALLISMADVLNLLASLMFVSGYIYFVTVIGFIFSTATVV